jgi:hypothetical protein
MTYYRGTGLEFIIFAAIGICSQRVCHLIAFISHPVINSAALL